MLMQRLDKLAAKVVRVADRGERPKRLRDPWASVFGHMTVFAIISVVITGVVLALWYRPSMSQVVYDGDYVPLRGVTMSEAYASTLDISVDQTGGLLIRQAHQWGTLVFVAAFGLYILRIFFTGAFRDRGMGRWLLFIVLFVLGIVAGYTGHLLPDDLLSGTSLRVIEGITLSVPILGSPIAALLFGGEFPGDSVIPVLYGAHIALPVVFFGIAATVLLLNRRYTGVPLRIKPPAKLVGVGLMVTGVIFAMAATIQVNPVWLWGPFDGANASAGSQPPWYVAFLDGGVRLMPAWSIDIAGYELTLSLIVPALLVPGLFIGAFAAYPLLERWALGDDRPRQKLDRMRDMPTRTGLGVGFVTFYLVLWIAAGNDVIASTLHVSVNNMTRSLQVGVFVLPVLAFWIARRISLGLLLRERDAALHGRETGVIVVSPTGGYSELHEPLSVYALQERAAHQQPLPLDPGTAADASGVRNPNYAMDRRRAQLSHFYFADLPRS